MNEYVYYYFFVINIVAILVTFYDKMASKYYTKNRVRENVLMLISVLGGSVFMYITMKMIRHKTRHAKFMIGIPVIIIIQILSGILLAAQKVL